MKKLFGAALALIAGIGVGGASAYGVAQYLRDPAAWTAPRLQFVATGAIAAPLVFPDGRLSSYVAFEVELEVASGEAERVQLALPLLMHGVNLRTYRKPLASGPDGLIPELEGLRAIVAEAAAEAYGKGVVRRVVITQARPI